VAKTAGDCPGQEHEITARPNKSREAVMNKKFEFTDEKHPTNPALHRIRALVDIPRAGVR
jgi:hypothetical protein